jgi:hypothetical protein
MMHTGMYLRRMGLQIYIHKLWKKIYIHNGTTTKLVLVYHSHNKILDPCV